MTAPSKVTVKFWAGPNDGLVLHESTNKPPSKELYLSVKDASEVEVIEPGMEFHYYELKIISEHVYEYVYKGVITK